MSPIGIIRENSMVDDICTSSSLVKYHPQYRLKPGVLNSFVVAKISVNLNLWYSNCFEKCQKLHFFSFLLSIWELCSYEAIVTSSVFDEFSATFKDRIANFWVREVLWVRSREETHTIFPWNDNFWRFASRFSFDLTIRTCDDFQDKNQTQKNDSIGARTHVLLPGNFATANYFNSSRSPLPQYTIH